MRTLIFLFFSISCFIMSGQSEQSIVPRKYVAYKVDKKMSIDGKAEEDDWKKAAWSQDFIDIEGVEKPRYLTQMKMLWDEDYFYVYAKMEEPHVWATLKQRDTIIFYNNDFEVFVDPDGDTHNYYELEFNALNTVWDLYLTKPYRGGNKTINDFDVRGLKSAIHVDGSLNNPKDNDTGWSIELAIPWSTFKGGYFQDIVPVDQYWRINFSRVNWDFDIVNNRYRRKKDSKGKFLHEYNWVWSPTGVINMHEPEKWAYVFFSSKKVGANVKFDIPKDEKIKWELFSLYRSQLQYFEKNEKWATDLNLLKPENIVVEGQTLVAQLETHSLGWNLKIKSPFSGKLLVVQDNGQFLVEE